MGCPDDDTLALLLAGEAPDEEALHEHIDGCPQCTAVLEDLAALFHDAGDDDEGPREGDTIAERYRLEHALGRGGMGVVHLAEDTRLRRRVALKLVRPEVALEHGEELQARLHREARAMARINDPAVVPVLDVGRVRGLVYVVMERVEGVTLRQWLRARPRSSAEIVRVLLEAGRGLLAAHRAGVVHRDFKPDNVMVGHDGRARVTDFGMASMPGGGPTEPRGWSGGSAELDTGDEPSTRTGTVMGTPAYMAPEQLDGRGVSPRSDQYAWCVVLVEALTGQRPFEALSLADLREAQRHPPDAARLEGLPARVREVVRRGLSEEPRQRWPSLAAALQQLERRISRGWRVGAVAALGLIGWWLVPTSATSAPTIHGRCEAGAEAIGAAWAGAEARRERELEGSGPAAEAELRRQVEAVGEAYARSCQTRPLPAPTTRTQALDCLDMHLARLQPIVERWGEGDDDVVLEPLADLRDPSVCFSADARPLPADPARAAEVRRLRVEIEASRSRLGLGEEQEAERRLEALRPQVEAVGFGPLMAEHGVLWGMARFRRGEAELALQTLEAAFWEAERAGDAWVAGRSATHLFRILGDTEERFEEADRWARHAEAALQRADDAIAWFHFHEGRATVAIRRADPAAAREHAERALEVAERLWPPGHRDRVTARSNLAVVDMLEGDFESAEREYRAVIAAREERFGPEHPDLATMLHGLADAVAQQGRPEEARPLLERSLAIAEAAHGADHPLAFDARNGLAIVTAMQGDFDEAGRLFTRSLALAEARFGPSHERTDRLRMNLGMVELERGNLDAAAQHLERSLRDRETMQGPTTVSVVRPLLLLAQVEQRRGDRAAALAHVERARVILDEQGDVEPVLRRKTDEIQAELTAAAEP